MSNCNKHIQQPPMHTQRFTSVAGVGDIWATEERYSEGKWFGVSWASTHLARVSSMEQAASIANAVAQSGLDNIHDMRVFVNKLLASE